ncbi:MAG: (Fe-S)-binding protein [Proteobacteria bacterium]|nr:(Fe-S)-binding protein [Pseudomonadota bacterium]
MFKPDQCNFCGECIERCQWMDVEKEDAISHMKMMAKGEKTAVLENCITCYACNEICPQDANPFDLFSELQHRYFTFASEDIIASTESRYVFSGELKDVPQHDRVMATCVFGKTHPQLIQGDMYNLPQVGGKPYFCWVLFSHMGAAGVQKNHAEDLVKRLAQTGAKEVVCFHDDCYAMLKKLAPDYGITVPFKPVHLAEYLVEYLTGHKSRIKPLNIKIAYQRPCASRHTPEKEHAIDELFDLIGVKRVDRAYDRGNALCCANVKLLLGQGDPAPDQMKNVDDAVNHGADAMVCLCPMCMQALSASAAIHQLPVVFLGDIARMAIGEIDPSSRQLRIV